jgi:hypothetical protein
MSLTPCAKLGIDERQLPTTSRLGHIGTNPMSGECNGDLEIIEVHLLLYEWICHRCAIRLFPCYHQTEANWLERTAVTLYLNPGQALLYFQGFSGI